MCPVWHVPEMLTPLVSHDDWIIPKLSLFFQLFLLLTLTVRCSEVSWFISVRVSILLYNHITNYDIRNLLWFHNCSNKGFCLAKGNIIDFKGAIIDKTFVTTTEDTFSLQMFILPLTILTFFDKVDPVVKWLVEPKLVQFKSALSVAIWLIIDLQELFFTTKMHLLPGANIMLTVF